MKTSYLIAFLLVSVSLAACEERAERPTEATAQAEPVSAAAAAAPAAAPINNLVKNVVADGVLFQPQAAKADGNALVSTGKAGFVMYGPYAPFLPGAYRVTINGSIPDLQNGAAARFDAVSGGGTLVHGEQVVTAAIPTSGTIAEFDIMIPEGVVDLELRARVTEGADLRIESYQVVKAN